MREAVTCGRPAPTGGRLPRQNQRAAGPAGQSSMSTTRTVLAPISFSMASMKWPIHVGDARYVMLSRHLPLSSPIFIS